MPEPTPQATPVPVEFGSLEWQEEVERFAENSPALLQAQRARREIRSGKRPDLEWQSCEADGPRGTKLPGCRKLYVPLGKQGASDAPFGFVFRLTQNLDHRPSWNMIAFGERHPSNPSTRSVYERAHKRLHDHYP